MGKSNSALIKLFSGTSPEINIFVHGFRSINTIEKLENLAYNILHAKPSGQVYLYAWKSDINFNSEAISNLILLVAKSKNQYVSTISLLSPILSIYARFKFYESRAAILGENLKRHISKIPGAKDLNIYLIGHSLGALVIFNALTANDWFDYNIKDIVLIGGCVDKNSSLWEDVIDQISGNIYNGYSIDDKILKKTPDFKKHIGRNKLLINTYYNNRIINHEFPSYSHSDYWPNLEEVLFNLWDNFIISNEYDVDENL